jgi:hypothetical protein
MMPRYKYISRGELIRVLDQHELYVRSGTDRGEPAHLHNYNLSRRNLSGRDLTGAWLSWSSLKSANLTGTILKGARLGETDLTNAKGLTLDALKQATTIIDTIMPAEFAQHFRMAKAAPIASRPPKSGRKTSAKVAGLT